MIRIIALFVFFVAAFHFAILMWRSATKRERWSFIKTLTYSAVVAILAVVAMSLLVIFF